MAFNYDNYLRLEKMPTLWCWGCGDGVILKAVIRAIDTLGWDMEDVCIVSGIGCSGRFSSYINANTVHTTHGRAIAYATGIKMANPDKKVIVVSGDGDSLAIGGNHTIHGCRRNIDIKHIMINNFIYGLTNSQTSPTTPKGFWTATAVNGNIDPNFNATKIATAAGATFVGRESMLDPKKLEKLFVKGFEHKGYSFFDVFSNCHINLGRKNKMGEASQNLEWIKGRIMPLSKFQKLEHEDRVDIFPTGVLVDKQRSEYCDSYKKVQDAAKNGTKIDFSTIMD